MAPWAKYVTAQRAMDPIHYLDTAIFEAEQSLVLGRTWQFACHGSDVENPGDFVAFEIAGEPLFAVRGQDGEIRTFCNVCMHRGHELVEGKGTKRQIVCPYHAWSYQLDGTLRQAPHAAGRPGFDAGEICLTEVRTENFAGFIFVNLDDGADPMDDIYPGARDSIIEFLPSIERMRPIQRREFTAESNWKVAVENYNECYHCKTAHPSFSKGVVLPDSYNIKPEGYCLRHRADSSPTQYYEIDLEASPHAAEYSSFYLWPLFSFQIYPGPILNTFCWRPAAVDRTPFFRDWYTLDGVESRVVLDVAAEDAKTTVAEDLDLVRSVQRGLGSRGYRPGPLILDETMGLNSEHTIAAIKSWYEEAMR